MKFFGGFQGKALRVNLTARTAEENRTDAAVERFLGGRGLNVYKLFKMVSPSTSPLAPDNPLIFGAGPMAGTLFPGSRFNVTAKSPHTGILGDSNAGGFWGAELKFAGYDQIILTGRSDKPVYLLITNEGVNIRAAEHLWGLNVWETDIAIREELDDDRVQVACVGPAAENGVTFAGIFANLARPAARTGMGTVMASKNVKAVAVRGRGYVDIFDPAGFETLIDRLDQKIFSHPEYQARCMMGTTKLVSTLNKFGALSTRHFQSGVFEHADQVSGELLAETYKLKSKACFSCTIPCSRFYRINSGQYSGLASEGPEFEALAGFTSRVGCSDLDFALKSIDDCNKMGIDVITTSECISFAMECFESGILTKNDLDGLEPHWGDKEAIQELIRKISYREGAGRLFSKGVRHAARAIGRGSEKLAMHVKGLEIFQAELRGLKGYALGFALSSRGGDHLRSEPSFEFSNDAAESMRRYGVEDAGFRLKYKGKGKLVKHYEEWSALADCLSVCKNTVVNMEIISFAEAAALLRVLTGFNFTEKSVRTTCERVVNLERAFIVRQGIRRKDDTLPERFLKEPLPGEHPSAGNIVELKPMLDEYYLERGWDLQTGIPLAQKLGELGLDDVIDNLIESGVPLNFK